MLKEANGMEKIIIELTERVRTVQKKVDVDPQNRVEHLEEELSLS